jgi:hypothetical protein
MSSSTIRTGLSLTAIATTAVLAIAGPASATKPKPVNVSATLSFTAPSTFSGNVSSKASACRKGAPLTLSYYMSSSDPSADTVATGKANKSGAFTLTVPNATAGEYQVTVGGRKVRESDGDIDKCRVFIGIRHDF